MAAKEVPTETPKEGDSNVKPPEATTGRNAVDDAYKDVELKGSSTPAVEPDQVDLEQSDELGSQTNRSVLDVNNQTGEARHTKYDAAGMESTSYPPGTQLDGQGRPPEGVRANSVIRQGNDGARKVEEYKYNDDGSQSEVTTSNYDRDRRLETSEHVRNDDQGNLIESTSTRYQSNSKGQIASSEAQVRDANGKIIGQNSTQYGYNEAGLPASEATTRRDADGNVLGTEQVERQYGDAGDMTVSVTQKAPGGRVLEQTTSTTNADGDETDVREVVHAEDGSQTVTVTQSMEDGSTRQIREQLRPDGTLSERRTAELHADQASEVTESFDASGNVTSSETIQVNPDGSITRSTTGSFLSTAGRFMSQSGEWPPGSIDGLAPGGNREQAIRNLFSFGDGSLHHGIANVEMLGKARDSDPTNDFSNGVDALNQLATQANTDVNHAMDAIGVYGNGASQLIGDGDFRIEATYGDHAKGIALLRQAGSDSSNNNASTCDIVAGDPLKGINILSTIGDGNAQLGMYRMQQRLGNGDATAATRMMEEDGSGTVDGAIPRYMRYSADGRFGSSIDTIAGADPSTRTFTDGRAQILGLSDQSALTSDQPLAFAAPITTDQTPTDRPPSSTRTDDQGNKIEEQYAYDDSGKRISSTSTVTGPDGNVTGTAETQYTYGDDGQLSSTVTTSKDAAGTVTGRQYTDAERAANGETTVRVRNEDAGGNLKEETTTHTDATGKVLSTTVVKPSGTGMATTKYEPLPDGGQRISFSRTNSKGEVSRDTVTDLRPDGTATEVDKIRNVTTEVAADGSVTRNGEQIHPPGTVNRFSGTGDLKEATQNIFRFGDGNLSRGFENVSTLGRDRADSFEHGIEVLSQLAKNGGRDIGSAMKAIGVLGRQNTPSDDQIWGDTRNGIEVLQRTGKDPAAVAALQRSIEAGQVSESSVSAVENGNALKGIDVFALIGDNDVNLGMDRLQNYVGEGDSNAALKMMEADGSGTVSGAVTQYLRYSPDGKVGTALETISGASAPGQERTFINGRYQVIEGMGDATAVTTNRSAFEVATDNLDAIRRLNGQKTLGEAITSAQTFSDNGTLIGAGENLRSTNSEGRVDVGVQAVAAQSDNGTFDQGVQFTLKAGIDKNGNVIAGVDLNGDGVIQPSEGIAAYKVMAPFGTNDYRAGGDVLRALATDKLPDGRGSMADGLERGQAFADDGSLYTTATNLDRIAELNGRTGDKVSAVESVRSFSDTGEFDATNLRATNADGSTTKGIEAVANQSDDGSFNQGVQFTLKAGIDKNGNVIAGVDLNGDGVIQPSEGIAAYKVMAPFGTNDYGAGGDVLRALATDKLPDGRGSMADGLERGQAFADDGSLYTTATNLDRIAELNGRTGDKVSAVESVRSFSDTGEFDATNLRATNADGSTTKGIEAVANQSDDGSFNQGVQFTLKAGIDKNGNVIAGVDLNGDGVIQPSEGIAAYKAMAPFGTNDYGAGGDVLRALATDKLPDGRGSMADGLERGQAFADDGSLYTTATNLDRISALNGTPGDRMAAVESVRSFSDTGEFDATNLRATNPAGSTTQGIELVAAQGDDRSFRSGVENTIAASPDGTPSGGVQAFKSFSDTGDDYAGGGENFRDMSTDGNTTSEGIEHAYRTSPDGTIAGAATVLRNASSDGTVSDGIHQIEGVTRSGHYIDGLNEVIAASPDGTAAGGVAHVSSVAPSGKFADGAAMMNHAGAGDLSDGNKVLTALGGGDARTGGQIMAEINASDPAAAAKSIEALGGGDRVVGAARFNEMVQEQGSAAAVVQHLEKLGGGDVNEGARQYATTAPPPQVIHQPQVQPQSAPERVEPSRAVDSPTRTVDASARTFDAPIRYVSSGQPNVVAASDAPIVSPRMVPGTSMAKGAIDDAASRIDALVKKLEGLTTAVPKLNVEALPGTAAVMGLRTPAQQAEILARKQADGAMAALRLADAISQARVLGQIAQMPNARPGDLSVHIQGAVNARHSHNSEVTISKLVGSVGGIQQVGTHPFRVVGPGGTSSSSTSTEGGLRASFTGRSATGAEVTVVTINGKVIFIRHQVGGTGRGEGISIDGGKISDALTVRRGMIKGGSASDAQGGIVLRAAKNRRIQRRQLIGIEIALALLLTSTAIARQLDASQTTPPADGDKTDDKDKNLAKASYQIVTRPTWLVRPGEDLVRLAEHLFHEPEIGWLIADLNVGQTRESFVDGKRIVELRTRQKIELPVWQDIVEFHKDMLRHRINADDLITVVNESAFDSELVQATLAPAMGLAAVKPIRGLRPAAAAARTAVQGEPAVAIAQAGFTGRVQLSQVRRAVDAMQRAAVGLIQHQEDTGGPSAPAGATVTTAIQQLKPKHAGGT